MATTNQIQSIFTANGNSSYVLMTMGATGQVEAIVGDIDPVSQATIEADYPEIIIASTYGGVIPESININASTTATPPPPSVDTTQSFSVQTQVQTLSKIINYHDYVCYAPASSASFFTQDLNWFTHQDMTIQGLFIADGSHKLAITIDDISTYEVTTHLTDGSNQLYAQETTQAIITEPYGRMSIGNCSFILKLFPSDESNKTWFTMDTHNGIDQTETRGYFIDDNISLDQINISLVDRFNIDKPISTWYNNTRFHIASTLI